MQVWAESLKMMSGLGNGVWAAKLRCGVPAVQTLPSAEKNGCVIICSVALHGWKRSLFSACFVRNLNEKLFTLCRSPIVILKDGTTPEYQTLDKWSLTQEWCLFMHVIFHQHCRDLTCLKDHER